MCEYLAICDSTFAAVTSSCSWHVALGVGTLFFGPIIVIILAMLRLTLYIHKHHDELYEKRPTPPSLLAVIRSVRKAKTLMGKWVLIKVYFNNAQVRGEWNDGDARILRWSWLISDYTRGTWGFALWLLVRRLYMSATVNLTDGPLNAGLSLAAQVVDTALIMALRPFNEHKTNVQEAVGALSNVLAYFTITLPILASPDILPAWIDDTATLVLSVVATGVAALFAMLGPLFTVLGLVKAACSKLLSLLPGGCLGMKSTAVGGAVAAAGQESMANLQEELTGMFEEYLEENFQEGGGDDDDEQDDIGEGHIPLRALAAGAVPAGMLAKWQHSRGDPARALQTQAADVPSGVNDKAQASEPIMIDESQLASLLSDGPHHVLAELGFTDSQITSARESMRYFCSPRSPRSGRDDQDVLTWVLAKKIQPQGQADTGGGSAQEREVPKVTVTLGHVSPDESGDSILLRSRKVRTAGEGWWVGEKSPEPLHLC